MVVAKKNFNLPLFGGKLGYFGGKYGFYCYMNDKTQKFGTYMVVWIGSFKKWLEPNNNIKFTPIWG